LKVNIIGREVNGFVKAPPSKSVTHRALICSALAPGESKLMFPLVSEDTEATKRVLSLLGSKISEKNNTWYVEGGNLQTPTEVLYCSESGTTLRFSTAICSLVEGECKLTGGASLSQRPIEPLLRGLRQLGVPCYSNKGFPPVVVKGTGKIKSGNISIRGDISSQFVSALLLVTPMGNGTTMIDLTTPLESKPYVSLTIDIQRRFGIGIEHSDDMRTFEIDQQEFSTTDIIIEGDWSSAAYILAAGALGGRVTVSNLNLESRQADRAIMEILREMGVKVVKGNGSISVRKSELEAIKWDLSDAPDLFPIVSTLCSAANGESLLKGLGRLRFKESDRIHAMVDGLGKMGIKLKQEKNWMKIEGGKPMGNIINPYKDHRIAMALGTLGLIADGKTTILDADCVSKSYPRFWEVLFNIGADVRWEADE
jgi:3-phosphoshikimate 1-carboxyvinyltransferase